MPVYSSDTPEGRRVISVKLDGREMMYELLVKTANTDEGWLDVYEYTVDDKGRKRLKMTDWEPVGYFRQVREPIVKRLHGKVEVVTGDKESVPEPVTIDPTE